MVYNNIFRQFDSEKTLNIHMKHNHKEQYEYYKKSGIEVENSAPQAATRKRFHCQEILKI